MPIRHRIGPLAGARRHDRRLSVAMNASCGLDGSVSNLEMEAKMTFGWKPSWRP